MRNDEKSSEVGRQSKIDRITECSENAVIPKQKVSTTKHNYYLQRLQHFASTLLIRKEPTDGITRIHNEIKTQHITHYKVMKLWRVASEKSSENIHWMNQKKMGEKYSEIERERKREKECVSDRGRKKSTHEIKLGIVFIPVSCFQVHVWKKIHFMAYFIFYEQS